MQCKHGVLLLLLQRCSDVWCVPFPFAEQFQLLVVLLLDGLRPVIGCAVASLEPTAPPWYI
jgi:hypothetical protein